MPTVWAAGATPASGSRTRESSSVSSAAWRRETSSWTGSRTGACGLASPGGRAPTARRATGRGRTRPRARGTFRRSRRRSSRRPAAGRWRAGRRWRSPRRRTTKSRAEALPGRTGNRERERERARSEPDQQFLRVLHVDLLEHLSREVDPVDHPEALAVVALRAVPVLVIRL